MEEAWMIAYVSRRGLVLSHFAVHHVLKKSREIYGDFCNSLAVFGAKPNSNHQMGSVLAINNEALCSSPPPHSNALSLT
jgi:hypothetical protein